MAGETRTLRVVIVGNSKGAQEALKSLGGASKKADKDFGGFAGSIGKKFAAIGAAIGSAQIARKIYEVGSSYEQNMNLIKNLDPKANIVATDKALQAQAGSLAKLGLSTVQGSEGLRELIKAGQSTKEAIASLNGTMTLATAGQLSAGDAAAIVANNLNAFGMKAGQAGDVANILANAANASSADVSDLGMALSQSGAVANAAQMNFAETAAAIAALSNVGIQGSDAGTSIKTMMMKLTAPTGAGAKAMDKLKLSVYDAKGELLPFPKMLDKVAASVKGMSDKKRAEALNDIFGSDAIRAANALIPQAGKGFADLTKAVTRAGGASKAASAQTAGFSGVLKEMKARGETAMQGLYSKVAPTLEKVGRKALEVGPQIQGAFKKGFTGGINPNALGGGFLGVIARIGNAVRELVTRFKGFASGGGGQAITKTFGAIVTFGKAMLPTLQEIGRNIMGVVGPAITEIGDLFRTKLLPAIQVFLPAITPVAKFLLKIFGSALVGLLQGAVSMIKGIINAITGIIQVFTALLTGNWSLAWTGIKNILLGAVQFIWGRIQWVWNMGIMSVFKKGFTFLKSIVTGGWGFIKSLFGSSTTALGKIVSKVVGWIKAPFTKAFSAVKGYVSEGWAYIRGRFSGGVGGVKAIVSRIIEVVTYPYRTAFTLAKAVVTRGWNAVKAIFKGGEGGIKGIVSRIPGVIKGVFSGALNLLKNVGRDIIGGLVAGINAGVDRVREAVRNLASKIPEPIRKLLKIASPSKVFAQFGEWIAEGLANGVKKGTKGVLDAMTRLAYQVRRAYEGGRITKAQKNYLLAEIQADGKRLSAAVKKREAIAARLKASNTRLSAATKALDNLKAAKATLAGKVGENVTKGVSFGENVDGPEGSGLAVILSRMKAKLAQAKAFTGNMRALAGRGVSASILQQLAEMGPDQGGMIAAELMRGSGGQLAQLNALQAQTEKLAGTAGNYVAGTVYDKSINSAQAKVITEQRINHKLEISLKTADARDAALAKAIAAEVRNEIARINKRNGKK